MAVEHDARSAEGVGDDALRAGLRIAALDGQHPLRMREIPGLAAVALFQIRRASAACPWRHRPAAAAPGSLPAKVSSSFLGFLRQFPLCQSVVNGFEHQAPFVIAAGGFAISIPPPLSSRCHDENGVQPFAVQRFLAVDGAPSARRRLRYTGTCRCGPYRPRPARNAARGSDSLPPRGPASRCSETSAAGPCWCRWFRHSGRPRRASRPALCRMESRSSAQRFRAFRFTLYSASCVEHRIARRHLLAMRARSPPVRRAPVLAGTERAALAGNQVGEPAQALGVPRQSEHRQQRFLGPQHAGVEHFHAGRETLACASASSARATAAAPPRPTPDTRDCSAATPPSACCSAQSQSRAPASVVRCSTTAEAYTSRKKYSSGFSSAQRRRASSSASGPAPTATRITLCASACSERALQPLARELQLHPYKSNRRRVSKFSACRA